MELFSLASAARRLRKRWLMRAAAHQRNVIRRADHELRRHELNAEFTKRLATLRLIEIESDVAHLDAEASDAS